jgi:arginine N-succinyltransferase
MIVVRAAHCADLDALYALAAQAGSGMTTLKPDYPALSARIARSQATFARSAPLAEQGYLFAMEDTATGRAVGVSGLEVAVGLTQPFYNYRISTIVQASRELNVWTRMRLLNITHDLTGYAELCSLFLRPEYRSGGNGALLSKARFMFLAQFPECFPERVCAELRGHFDDDNTSPFWREVGSHFYQISFEEADYLSAHGKKSFVAELMPRQPVYVDLLPTSAQDAIGRTHRDTAPARSLLESEGMRFENHIDIFDAGPVLEGHVDTLRGSRESVLAPVTLARDASDGGVRHLVSNTRFEAFRVIVAPRGVAHGQMRLTPSEAEALQVATGDTVRVLALHPRKNDR